MQVTSLGDYSTLNEVFVEQVYTLEDGHAPLTIVDLGSNIGTTILYFKFHCPLARVWGYEPDPRNMEQLRTNAAALPGVTLYEVAAAGRCERATFSADAHRGTSSALVAGGQGPGSMAVRTWTLDRILDETGREQVDLVKFDIEGAEYELFAAFRGWERVRTFAGELHPCNPTGDADALCAIFSARGFAVRTRDVDQTGTLHVVARREQLPP